MFAPEWFHRSGVGALASPWKSGGVSGATGQSWALTCAYSTCFLLVFFLRGEEFIRHLDSEFLRLQRLWAVPELRTLGQIAKKTIFASLSGSFSVCFPVV